MAVTDALWYPDDQAARLAELTSHDPKTKEAPLRRDVRSLGRLLGEVLKEQVGQAFFEKVETIRLLAIQQRELNRQQREIAGSIPGDDISMEQLSALISAMTATEAHLITKAFAIYFDLTNLAETNHRKRRRRASLRSVVSRCACFTVGEGRLVAVGGRRNAQS